jgi:hypothetical protein
MIDNSYLSVGNVNFAVLCYCLAVLICYGPHIIVIRVVISTLVSRTGNQLREILKFIIS